MRNHYWTTSKFADWLRGTVSPVALTHSDWKIWRKTAREAHPVRYWLADDGLNYLQKFFYYIPDKLYDLKYYINNRWVTHTNALRAHPRDIVPGSWMDLGDRFLPCLFNELVDFVEVELAWWHIAWSEIDQAKYKAPWYASGWFRWRTWRCPQAGLDNLAWQMTCDNKDYTTEDDPNYGALTQQAYNAMEIAALYKWWTEERPNRPDPYEVSGWNAYIDSKYKNGKDTFFDDLDSGKVRDTSSMHEMMNEIDTKYAQEDEEMLIRLIKVRHALWT